MGFPGKFAGITTGLIVLAVYGGIQVIHTTDRSPASVASSSPLATPSNERQTHSGALGVASCAAQGCHGDSRSPLPPSELVELAQPNAKDYWKSSYFQWHNHDRHAHAYEVLQLDRSQQIMKRLGKDNSATEEKACLACHVNPTLASRADDPGAKELLKEGVSCEACHGDASRWRSEHYTWKADDDREALYASVKMTKLYDLGERASTCLGCHVGAPANEALNIPIRDVNHDLIAAGHPRLNFEFATYLRKLPPHWVEKDRLKNEPRPAGYEAQVWLVGQAANAEATLKLMQARAGLTVDQNKNEKSVVWPELADFNCFACHHRLSSDGPGGHAFSRGSRKLGGLVWNRPVAFGSQTHDESIRQALKQFDSVEAALYFSLNGKPGLLDHPLNEAIATWENVRQRFVQERPDDALVPRAIELLRPDEAFSQRLGWDDAAHLFSGIIAIENARRQLRANPDRICEDVLIDLHDLLKLPREPVHFDSPIGFNQDEVRSALRRWFEATIPVRAPPDRKLPSLVPQRGQRRAPHRHPGRQF